MNKSPLYRNSERTASGQVHICSRGREGRDGRIEWWIWKPGPHTPRGPFGKYNEAREAAHGLYGAPPAEEPAEKPRGADDWEGGPHAWAVVLSQRIEVEINAQLNAAVESRCLLTVERTPDGAYSATGADPSGYGGIGRTPEAALESAAEAYKDIVRDIADESADTAELRRRLTEFLHEENKAAVCDWITARNRGGHAGRCDWMIRITCDTRSSIRVEPRGFAGQGTGLEHRVYRLAT